MWSLRTNARLLLSCLEVILVGLYLEYGFPEKDEHLPLQLHRRQGSCRVSLGSSSIGTEAVRTVLPVGPPASQFRIAMRGNIRLLGLLSSRTCHGIVILFTVQVATLA